MQFYPTNFQVDLPIKINREYCLRTEWCDMALHSYPFLYIRAFVLDC